MEDNILRLRRGKNGMLHPGHPWIYKRQILKPDFPIKQGGIVSVLDSGGKFRGSGYYNPASDISVRLLTFKDEQIDKKLLSDRMALAVEKRRGILQKTNACRMIFSEADGLCGLIADMYDDTIVFQVLTFGMERMKEAVVDLICEVIKPKYIYEKSRSPFRKLEGLKDAERWWTAERPDKLIQIYEGKVRFFVNIEECHKTGFYLDQRRSRFNMELYSKGRDVLDLFCYTGGFSVSSAFYGAGHVLGVDIKEDWLTLARKNAELNGVAQKIEFVKGDVFDFLRNASRSGRRFDIIILDPPSFLKNRESIKSASKGYEELNRMAMAMVNTAGVLATFSCSHNMPGDRFSDIIKEAARQSKKKISILNRCHQAEDHPIVRSIPETEYLKGYFLRVYE